MQLIRFYVSSVNRDEREELSVKLPISLFFKTLSSYVLHDCNMLYHLSTGVKAPPSKSFRTMVNPWIMLRVFWSRHILKLPKVGAHNCQGALQLKVGQPHGWSWEGHRSGLQGPRKAANHIWQTFVLCWRRFGTVVLCFRVPLQWESDSHPKVRIYKICVQFQGSSTLLDLLVKTKKQNQYHSLSKSSWFSLLPALFFLTLPLLTAFQPQPLAWGRVQSLWNAH